MQCPECKVDAYIMGSRTEVVGDQSPDTQTEVWQVMTFECRNDRCPMRGRQVGELRHRVYPPPEEIEEPSRGSKENTLVKAAANQEGRPHAILFGAAKASYSTVSGRTEGGLRSKHPSEPRSGEDGAADPAARLDREVTA